MSTVIPLASHTLNAAGDRIAVELHRPPDTPPFVLVTWPSKPTPCSPPGRFLAVALAAIAVLDDAMVEFGAQDPGAVQ